MVRQNKGWYYSNYLPHFDEGELVQFITFRLAGSIPFSKMEILREELSSIRIELQDIHRRKRIEQLLDQGNEECFLKIPVIAELVQQSILFWNKQRYLLHSWVIMPNHVHILCTVLSGNSLPNIVQNWKSYTSKKATSILGRNGPFWEKDYFDRFIRSEEHFRYVIEYIHNNPAKAGLCRMKEDWLYSSANPVLQDSCGRDAHTP